MTDPTQAAPRGFFCALFCDENGTPDELNVVLLSGVAVMSVGAFLPHFPFAEYAAALVTLIPLYQAARGDWRKS